MTTINVQVTTQFGCICCNCCRCNAGGKGRTYDLKVRNADTIESIYDAMAEQCPEFKTKGVKPTLFFVNEVLDWDRRIINYDMIDGSQVICIVPTKYCCTRAFRKKPRDKGQVTDDDEGEDMKPKGRKVMGSADDTEEP